MEPPADRLFRRTESAARFPGRTSDIRLSCADPKLPLAPSHGVYRPKHNPGCLFHRASAASGRPGSRRARRTIVRTPPADWSPAAAASMASSRTAYCCRRSYSRNRNYRSAARLRSPIPATGVSLQRPPARPPPDPRKCPRKYPHRPSSWDERRSNKSPTRVRDRPRHRPAPGPYSASARKGPARSRDAALAVRECAAAQNRDLPPPASITAYGRRSEHKCTPAASALRQGSRFQPSRPAPAARLPPPAREEASGAKSYCARVITSSMSCAKVSSPRAEGKAAFRPSAYVASFEARQRANRS